MVPMGEQSYASFDNAQYSNLVAPFQRGRKYSQKWVAGDPINWQISTTFSPISLEVRGCTGELIQSYAFTARSNSAILPGWALYELSHTPPAYGKDFFFILSVGEGPALVRFISEPQRVVPDNGYTVLCEYWHSRNIMDIVFGTGQKYYFRFEGGLLFSEIEPQFKGTDWEDQPLNLRTNYAVAFEQLPLLIGGSYGVASWVVEKMNRILSCDNFYIGDVQYTRPADQKFDFTRDRLYSLVGASVLLQTTKNRDRIRAQNNESLAESFFVTYDIETPAFGTYNAPVSSNPIQITEVE